MGKTALAVRLAREAAKRSPDGALFVDPQGYDPGKLGLTPAAVWRHVYNLLAEGLMETRTARKYGNRGRGRPAKVFGITDTGRNAFEHAYDDLATGALRFLAETAGPYAVAEFTCRQLAALERRQLTDEYEQLMTQIADYEGILASPERQRQIIGEELGEIVAKYGNDRRTQIIAYDGDVTNEDLIAEEDVVVTITRGGYAKRTKTDLYRAQRRGGKGVRGAQLRTDDIVDHFFVTTTHHWILFFTNKGRVYRAKAYELPDAARDARGQHVANLLAFQPDERIAEVLALRDYSVAPYLVLATKGGLVKKSRLTDFDSPRAGGVIAINLREDDEVIAARLMSPDQDLLLVSKKAQALRFHATDEVLRPMGRATSGVIGMRFANGDELLGMYVVREGADVLVATAGGYAKRTPAGEYPVKGRGTMGVVTARIVDQRGELVGALMVLPEDEVFAITSTGGVIRTSAAEVKQSGRQTMGVRLMNLAPGDSVVAVARNAEAGTGTVVDADEPEDEEEVTGDGATAEAAPGAVDEAGDASSGDTVPSDG